MSVLILLPIYSLVYDSFTSSQDIHPNTTRTGLWMHDTVPRMFSVCRIPRSECDTLSTPDKSSPHRNKVVVLLHDWIYSMDVYDGSTRNIGHREIEKRLRSIVLDVKDRVSTGEKAVPVSVLTSDDRDIWTKVRCTFIARHLTY